MMESLETGRCLWMVSNQNIFGFRVEKLELLGKNDARDSKPILLELPFDINLKLPKRDLRPFVFDSKLFFAGDSPDFSATMYQLSSDAGGTTLDIAEVEPAAGTIPDPPTRIYEFNVANVQGDVYLLAHDPTTKERRLGFWVLRSGPGSKQWHPLSPPPTLSNYGTDVTYDEPPYVFLPWWDSFVWNDQLFLKAFLPPDERKSEDGMVIYYVYHPENDDPWKRIKRPFTGSGHLSESGVAAVPSLGKVGNCDVALTWMTEDYDLTNTSDVKIYALLVDKQENVLRKECLHEAIPYSFISFTINVNFVDLGEGKVCVLIGGTKARSEIPTPNLILCVLVLKLGLVQEDEEGQRFLSVDEVLVNRVYDMTPYVVDNYDEAPRSSFLSSFKHPYSQGSNSPRKEPKLASGTNPTNPRALCF